MAVCALATIEYLRGAGDGISEQRRLELENHLDGYLGFLLEARNDQLLWYSSYNLDDGGLSGTPSPYFDGEALLAMVKAAKHLGREHLKPAIIESALAGHRINIEQALAEDPDSATTKGYYQWSSMACFELATSGWPNTEALHDDPLARGGVQNHRCEPSLRIDVTQHQSHALILALRYVCHDPTTPSKP